MRLSRESSRLHLLFASLLLVVAAGCATNPATGRRQLMLISEGQEIQMGRQADQEVSASLGLYDDRPIQSYVHELGLTMARSSERPDLPWAFRVLDDPVVNAFALPGGFIYVTRGILTHLGSEAELVAVVGHEIGHVTARHGANRLSKAQLATLGLGVGAAIKPDLMENAGSLAQIGLGMLFLKYGRDDEREADELGFRYMTRNGYAPQPMADVFNTLERVSAAAGAGRIPNWMATHPHPAERRERVLARIAEHDGNFPGNKIGRVSYLRRLDDLVYGEDPRQGFFEQRQFMHPEMRFRMRFPRGWKTANQRDAVMATSQQRDGMVRLSISSEVTADAASRKLVAQQGIEELRRRRVNQHGNRGVEVDFEAQSRSGVVRGRVVFLAFRGRVFELLGLATEEAFRGYDRSFADSLSSFRELRDRRALSVQPNRLELVELRRDTTIADFYRRYNMPVTVQTAALINGVTLEQPLKRRTLVKRVVAGR